VAFGVRWDGSVDSGGDVNYCGATGPPCCNNDDKVLGHRHAVPFAKALWEGILQVCDTLDESLACLWSVPVRMAPTGVVPLH
jgi:hypothetical protein